MRKTEDEKARHSDLWTLARKFVEVSIWGEERSTTESGWRGKKIQKGI